ncbi:unnamed protein product [Microthlaspi erraticum]|uniref:Uncharacterized protein n=1 Tax=Microthlaspi erraticum TaxID=1685480 RepID=A0A6D2JI93_9BRAS|nr:unnamed protein product [Microthlaspi erraticum]
MEISYLDKQEGYENRQRMSRYCPPKNWEARSWSGEGKRPSGALHSTMSMQLDRACGSLLLPRSVCGYFGLGGAWLARTDRMGSIGSLG